MGLDEIVQQLKGARATVAGELDRHKAEVLRLEGELERLEAAIIALDGADGTKVLPIPAKPAAVRTATKPGAGRSNSPAAARERWQPVFDWVAKAKADGTYTLAGLVERHGGNAKNWQVAAKRYGVTVGEPATPEPLPQAKGAKVLAYDDCDATFEIDRISRLRTHTIAVHGRGSSEAERTPIANPTGAA
jgi:hypothetical protein